MFIKVFQKNTTGEIKNVICNSAKQGLIPQREYFDKDIANSDNTSGFYIIKNNDFVYNPRKSSDAPYGPVSRYKYSENGIVSPLYLCFRARIDLLSEYFDFYFKSPAWHRYIYMCGDSGARHDRVSIKDDVFFAMPVKLPSINEQEKIAKLLLKIEEKIQKQQLLVETLKKYKRGLLNRIFKNNDTTWIEYKLSDIGVIQTGTTPSTTISEYYGEEYLWVTPTDITGKETSHTAKKLSKIGYEKSRKISANSVLCTCIASIGKNTIIRENGSCNQQINAITPYSNFDVDFVYYVLCYNEFNMHNLAGSGGMEILNKQAFSNMRVKIPSLETQRYIASILNQIEANIKVNQELLTLLNKLKKSLLQQLFI